MRQTRRVRVCFDLLCSFRSKSLLLFFLDYRSFPNTRVDPVVRSIMRLSIWRYVCRAILAHVCPPNHNNNNVTSHARSFPFGTDGRALGRGNTDDDDMWRGRRRNGCETCTGKGLTTTNRFHETFCYLL